MELAGIGSFAVEAPRVERGDDRWWIALEGTLTISGFEFPKTIVRIPVGGSLSDVDVRMPGADDALGSAIAAAVIDLLPIAPDAPQVRNVYFGPLDARGTLHGLRFDIIAGSSPSATAMCGSTIMSVSSPSRTSTRPIWTRTARC
jgi:hypothetical protein